MEAALATLPLAELQSRLTEALDAAHRLYVGAREVIVQEGQSQVTYQQGQRAGLESYIAKLQAAISAKETGAPVGGRPVYLEF